MPLKITDLSISRVSSWQIIDGGGEAADRAEATEDVINNLQGPGTSMRSATPLINDRPTEQTQAPFLNEIS